MKNFSGGKFLADTGKNDEVDSDDKIGKEEKDQDDGRDGGDMLFDMVTGTPPYFPSKNGALPVDAGRGQCAFECRGGIEVYLETCTRNMSHRPHARFIVCQTYLEVQRTERSALKNRLVITKRLDVYGKEGHADPLFCVFSMRRASEGAEEQSSRVGIGGATGEEGGREGEGGRESEGALLCGDGEETRVVQEVQEEEGREGTRKYEEEGKADGNALKPKEKPYSVVPLYVRKLCGCHTVQYDDVMRCMGRPLSTCHC